MKRTLGRAPTPTATPALQSVRCCHTCLIRVTGRWPTISLNVTACCAVMDHCRRRCTQHIYCDTFSVAKFKMVRVCLSLRLCLLGQRSDLCRCVRAGDDMWAALDDGECNSFAAAPGPSRAEPAAHANDSQARPWVAGTGRPRCTASLERTQQPQTSAPAQRTDATQEGAR